MTYTPTQIFVGLRKFTDEETAEKCITFIQEQAKEEMERNKDWFLNKNDLIKINENFSEARKDAVTNFRWLLGVLGGLIIIGVTVILYFLTFVLRNK